MSSFFDRFVNINNVIRETITSALDQQVFNVGKNGSVDVDGAPAFIIENDVVDIINSGNISTSNAPVTIDVSGDDALIINNEGGTISANGGEAASGTAINITGDAAIINRGSISSGLTSVNFSGADASGSLINSGVITSDSRGVAVDGNGVTFNNFGDVIGTGNQRNGTVYSNDTAFDFTIFNRASGTIDAGLGNNGTGISLSLSADEDVNATVLNDGLIAGRGNAGAGSAQAGDGIRIETIREGGALGANTGTFTGLVDNIGTITSDGANGTVGGFRAVNGVNFQGELLNGHAGTISGVQNGVYFGTGDHDGGVVNNFGTISSDSRAFNVDGEGLEINNHGTIIATSNQRNGTFYADSTAQDFTLNNSGVIDAGIGLEGAAISVELAEDGNDFDINNSGQILGTGNAAAGSTQAGDGIRLERARVDGALDGTTTGLFTGEINNSGLIASEQGANGTVAGFRAVNGVSFQGELNNEGTISGVQNGVYFGNATPAGGANHTGGVVNNFGTISSDSRAFNIDGTGLEVNNEGQIIGTGNQRNGTLYADGTAQDFSVYNSGLIDAGEGNIGSGFAAEIGADGNSFEFENEGTIQGRGQGAAGGGAAGDGFRLGNVGNSGIANVDFENSGLIASESNVGTVAGFRVVNNVGFQGSLENEGTISGVRNGVYFGDADHTGGVVENEGTISSDSRAFNIDGTGLEIDNSGTIIATGTQRNGTVYADSTAQDFTLNNSGVIDAGVGLEGAGFSVELAETGNTFTIHNSGQIFGTGNAGAGTTQAGDGIRLERTRVDGALDGTTTGLFDGLIVNDGLITAEQGANGTVAGFRAVNGVSFQGTLINESGGTISGVQNGVYFGNATPAGGADHSGGLVVNEGLISSGSRAFNIDGSGLAVVNQGDILGTGNQRNGTVYADVTADDYVFVNGSSGRVDAGHGNDGAAVSLQVGDNVSAVVVNDGTFQGQGDAISANGIGHGLRLFPGAGEDSTFDGVLVNFGTIRGSDDSDLAAGVSIEGVELTGVLANFGTIEGSQIGIDASGANGVNIFNSGTINGDVLLSGGDDVFVLTSNGVVEGHIDGGEGFDTISLVGFSESDANELLESGQLSGFENVVFGDDFGFNNFVTPAADASFFNGGEDFLEDEDAAANIDLLAELATVEADFAAF